MRALFLKELNQGRPLLVFALVLALLLPLGCAVVSRALFRLDPGFEPSDLQLFFGFAALLAPILIAILASAGIFSGEVAAGTTPLLFALPLSRRRIWAAMALAALALTAAAAIILLGLGRLLLPSAFRLLSVRAYLPDLICLTLFFLSVGIFCSSLTRSVTAALAVSVLLAGALIGGAIALVTYFGAPLLGLPTIDTALWCLLASPALLLSSLLPITRGELLTAPRKWHALAVFTAALGLAATLTLSCGVARLATRYHRPAVDAVSDVSLGPDGRTLSFVAHGRSVPFSTGRIEMRAIFMQAPFAPQDTSGTLPLPTANSALVLDLDTDKELFTARVPTAYLVDPGMFASFSLSPDGDRLSLLTGAPGLTWGRREGRGQQLRIVDIEENREVYRGSPDPLQWGDRYTISWSPTGRYFALRRKEAFHVFSADGPRPDERPVPIRLDSAAWSPADDVIFGIDRNGALARAFPDGRKTEVIWTPSPDTADVERRFGTRYISPDGRWIVLPDTISRNAENDLGETYEQHLSAWLLVNTEDGRSQEIWRAPDEETRSRALQWLPDGTLLALQIGPYDRTIARRAFHLLTMRPGEDRLSPVGWEIEATSVRLFVGPTPDEVFVYAQSWKHTDEQSRGGRYYVEPTLEREELTAVSMDGSTRLLDIPPNPGALPYSERIVGFDHRGRLIVLGASQRDLRSYPAFDRVDALDVATGEVTTIYP